MIEYVEKYDEYCKIAYINTKAYSKVIETGIYDEIQKSFIIPMILDDGFKQLLYDYGLDDLKKHKKDPLNMIIKEVLRIMESFYNVDKKIFIKIHPHTIQEYLSSVFINDKLDDKQHMNKLVMLMGHINMYYLQQKLPYGINSKDLLEETILIMPWLTKLNKLGMITYASRPAYYCSGDVFNVPYITCTVEKEFADELRLIVGSGVGCTSSRYDPVTQGCTSSRCDPVTQGCTIDKIEYVSDYDIFAGKVDYYQNIIIRACEKCVRINFDLQNPLLFFKYIIDMYALYKKNKK